MTTDNDGRNRRDALNFVLVIVAAIAAAYVVFLWLN